MLENIHSSDVLVIGSGLTGIRAAVAASEAGASVIMVSCGRGASSEVIGFNAPVGLNDSVDIYLEDTLRCGGYINNRKIVEVMVNQAIANLEEMEHRGLDFDKTEGSDYHLLQPLGCSKPRMVHYKNQTGSAIMKLLLETPAMGRVRREPSILVTDIFKDDDKVIGACGLDLKNGELVGFQAKSVVLAAGGAGNIIQPTTYPRDVNGGGYALAIEAGAELVDMEFLQFEPCVYVYPEKLKGTLVVTTLLSAGGQLKNRLGEQFMYKHTPLGAKVPKDMLSRMIFLEVQAGRGTDHGGVFLDCSMLPRDVVVKEHERFYKCALKAGVDLTRDLVEVAPYCHTSLGGVKVDEHCETSVKRMFAAGEVSGGVHGANRIGGNAGTEILVFGKIAGNNSALRSFDRVNHAPKQVFEEQFGQKKEFIKSRMSDKIKSASSPRRLRKDLGRITFDGAGIVRTRTGMSNAMAELDRIQELMLDTYCQNTAELLDYQVALGMVITAKAVFQAALLRTESRGVHFRQDYPEQDDGKWLQNIVIKKKGRAVDFTMNSALCSSSDKRQT